MGVEFVGVRAHPRGEEIGHDEVTDQAAVSFGSDEAFVIEGPKESLVKMLEDAAQLVRELPDE
ncbi:hypothetical protein SEA_BRUHMOMENT_76 [Arthrobacter phage BruhMoment]|nr:hypothetical protein SEA_BRUHMOMENT_76 [Arthrobacter phage BruhMoment]